MNRTKNNKELIEKKFQDLVDKAKLMYPNIEDSIATFNNVTAETTSVQDYINLTQKVPNETSSNQTLF